MDFFRVSLVTAFLLALLSGLIETFIYESAGISIVLAAWTAFGYSRVFGAYIGAPTYATAIKGALMSLAWPLVPKRS